MSYRMKESTMLGKSAMIAFALAAAIAIPAAATAEPGIPSAPQLKTTVTTVVGAAAAAVNAAVPATKPARPAPHTRTIVFHEHYKLATIVIKNGKRTYRQLPARHIARQLSTATTSCPPSDGYLHCVHVPLLGPLINGCNGDVVELQDGSDWQFMDGLTVDPVTGAVTTKNRSNWQGVHGVAPDGTLSSAADTQREQSSFVPFSPLTGASFSQTIDENYELISQGSDPNQVIHMSTVLSVVVHPDFTVDSTTTVTGPDNPCRG
jgi:hypothetical protein